MPNDYSRFACGLLAIWLGLAPGLGLSQARKAMPTAMLPIEPASPDHNVLNEQKSDAAAVMRREQAVSRSRTQYAGEGREASVHGGLLMTQSGFGAQLRFLEYSSPWLAISQALRYQTQEEAGALFATQYGLMLGLQVHPWRQSRFSPVLSLEAGGDRYRRGLEQDDLDLFGFEAAIGLELKLARAASFLFQWTELYYPGLQEQLFIDQKPGTRYAGSFQVFFNLKWQGLL
jgi:hypothetical protein